VFQPFEKLEHQGIPCLPQFPSNSSSFADVHGRPEHRRFSRRRRDDTCFRILDQHDTMLTAAPRTNTEVVTRYQGIQPQATILTGAGMRGEWISQTTGRHSESQPC
jgi:hypothetical protein